MTAVSAAPAAISDQNLLPLVDLPRFHRPLMNELREAFERVVRNASFIGGPEVENFERGLANYVGVSQAVGVASGTGALHLALRAAGIGTGDEVVVPAMTFFATASAVIQAGATPVLADVDIRTGLLDPVAAEAAIGPRTRALIAVHLYGQPVDADRFRSLADRHGLLFVEDAAQAIGAAWEGRPVGSLGDVAAFSFYPGKNLGGLGDGGAVVTNIIGLADRLRLLRAHGEAEKNLHVEWAFNERLDGLQAAFLSVKLRHLPSAQTARDAAAAYYRRLLAGVDGVGLLETVPGARHVHHLLVVRVHNRDAVLAELHRAGIGAGIHYPRPIHLQPAWKGEEGRGSFRAAESLADSILSLPLTAGMTAHEVERVVDTLSSKIRQTA